MTKSLPVSGHTALRLVLCKVLLASLKYVLIIIIMRKMMMMMMMVTTTMMMVVMVMVMMMVLCKMLFVSLKQIQS